MASTLGTDSTMSFFTLPAEVRLRIYKYLWQGTWLEVRCRKPNSEMMEWEDSMYRRWGGSWDSMSALLGGCRQMYCEALPVFHDCVQLRTPWYHPERAFDGGWHERFAQRLDEQANFSPPFKGFRNIWISSYYAEEQMPIIARLCPDIQVLTFCEHETGEFGYTWVNNTQGVTEEAVLKSKASQQQLFDNVHTPDGEGVSEMREVCLAKCWLAKVKGFKSMEHVLIVLEHEIEVEGWVDSIRATFDIQSGVLSCTIKEGRFEVEQVQYNRNRRETLEE